MDSLESYQCVPNGDKETTGGHRFSFTTALLTINRQVQTIFTQRIDSTLSIELTQLRLLARELAKNDRLRT